MGEFEAEPDAAPLLLAPPSAEASTALSRARARRRRRSAATRENVSRGGAHRAPETAELLERLWDRGAEDSRRLADRYRVIVGGRPMTRSPPRSSPARRVRSRSSTSPSPCGAPVRRRAPPSARRTAWRRCCRCASRGSAAASCPRRGSRSWWSGRAASRTMRCGGSTSSSPAPTSPCPPRSSHGSSAISWPPRSRAARNRSMPGRRTVGAWSWTRRAPTAPAACASSARSRRSSTCHDGWTSPPVPSATVSAAPSSRAPRCRSIREARARRAASSPPSPAPATTC